MPPLLHCRCRPSCLRRTTACCASATALLPLVLPSRCHPLRRCNRSVVYRAAAHPCPSCRRRCCASSRRRRRAAPGGTLGYCRHHTLAATAAGIIVMSPWGEGVSTVLWGPTQSPMSEKKKRLTPLNCRCSCWAHHVGTRLGDVAEGQGFESRLGGRSGVLIRA